MHFNYHFHNPSCSGDPQKGRFYLEAPMSVASGLWGQRLGRGGGGQC